MLKRVALLLAALALVAAPAAQADDSSVLQAWNAHDAKFKRLGEKVRETERSNRTARQKAKRIIALTDDARELLAENTAGVKAEQASSEKGAEGRRLALKSNARFDAELAATRKGLRLFLDGASERRVDSYLRRAEELTRESLSYAKRARKAFREAGLDVE